MTAAKSEDAPWSRRSLRRVLFDMHVPDWDPSFLAKLDPGSLVAAVVASGAEAALLYFQSHVGLCNWLSNRGQLHRGIADPRWLEKTIAALAARGLPAGAYFSVHFDNWASQQHPQWRFQPLARNGLGLLPASRYGLCCSNHPEYREYVRAQAVEIAGSFAIDVMFFDMMWQPGICGCAHCRARFASETGREFPRRVDWQDPAWCAFQAARERWTADWACELRGLVRSQRPDIEVYHNFAMGIANWSRAQGFASAAGHDFLGGDFYGGRDEQLVVCKLLQNLSDARPIEFMTTVTPNLTDHETLKSQDEHDTLAFAATAQGAAFLAIAPIDPAGTFNPGALEVIRRSFEQIAPYQRFLGGTAIEEVAVYFSSDSKMRLDENGQELAELVTAGSTDYPHFHAVRGASAALQAAHIPFGIITRKQLGALDRHRVVVLPNLLRMDAEECQALREYVRGGGRVYASRLTSLLDTAGRRGSSFALADVFGVDFVAEEAGQVVYLEPSDAALSTALAPQRRLAQGIDRNAGAVRIRSAGATPLAMLSLPAGHPRIGSVGAADWSSIHSSPPFEATEAPPLVRHRFGSGEAIYSAADIEAAPGASRRVFVQLLRRLLGPAPLRITASAPPSVWINAFEQRERMIVTLLNHQSDPGLVPIAGIELTVRARPGRRIRAARLVPLESELPMRSTEDSSAVEVSVPRLERFALLIIDYQKDHQR